MRHSWPYHADILHAETPELTEATPLDNDGSIVGYVAPDLLHKSFPCCQGDGGMYGMLRSLFQLCWKF
jgi:hypothetical protein